MIPQILTGIYSFNKSLLIAYYMTGCVLDTRDTKEKKSIIPALKEPIFWGGEVLRKGIKRTLPTCGSSTGF